MRITYGTHNSRIDVTDTCLRHPLCIAGIVTIPSGDYNRTRLFNDPVQRIFKSIFITEYGETTEYAGMITIEIDLYTRKVRTISDESIMARLSDIHRSIQMRYGSMNDELPEQILITKYLTGDEKVLEIGSNVGRSSLVISSILREPRNLVTLECDLYTYEQLREHRDINNRKFHTESSALSKRKVIQKDWNTLCSDVLIDGYQWVSTITMDELNAKYQIEFDTLVLDCEGAFCNILRDMPEVLDNIKMIIMENDYKTIADYEFVHKTLVKHGFYVDFMEHGGGGPCYMNFYEVWKRVMD